MHNTDSYIEVEGARAHMIEAGAGAPIVILASPLVWARSYRPLVRLLAYQARVIAVDLPGAASSSRLATPWTFAQYARWTRALLDKLALDNVTLIGHSNSGPIAMLAAEGSPGPIARLVLADIVGVRRKRSLPRVSFARFIDGIGEPILTLRATPDFLGNLLRHTRTLLAQVRFSSRADVLHSTPDVRIPTLLAWGEHDRTMPVEGARRLQQALPSASLFVGPGRHDWLVTHAEEFVRALLEFMAETPHHSRPPDAPPRPTG